MGSDKILSTEDLEICNAWLEEDVIHAWMKCAEYLINKYKIDELVIRHKRLSDGNEEEFKVGIHTRKLTEPKVIKSIQTKRIVEDAGIAMGLLMTLFLRNPADIRVVMEGEGYDYRYIPHDSREWELIEITGTEVPGSGKQRLNDKIRKFKSKHPGSAGYISVSCFCDKLQLHWGHKN